MVDRTPGVPDAKSCTHRFWLSIGAPERIRTSDPQIRSLTRDIDPLGSFYKPDPFPAEVNQCDSGRFANRYRVDPWLIVSFESRAGPETKAAAPAGTGSGGGSAEGKTNCNGAHPKPNRSLTASTARGRS
jgi:hypothetical protein